jgi:hypothetical protein
VGGGGCHKAEDPQASIEPLYRAVRLLNASADIGISLPELSEQIKSAQREWLIAKDRATPAQQQVVTLYADSLSAYKDGREFWQVAIAAGAEQLPTAVAFVGDIATKYQVMPQVTASTDTQTYSMISRDETLKAIWTKAGEKSEVAHKAFLALKPGA